MLKKNDPFTNHPGKFQSVGKYNDKWFMINGQLGFNVLNDTPS